MVNLDPTGARKDDHALERPSADISLYGADHSRAGTLSTTPHSIRSSWDANSELPTGAQTPTPLLAAQHLAKTKTATDDRGDELHVLQPVTSRGTQSHLGDALENLYRTQTARSRAEELARAEAGISSPRGAQGVPPELGSFTIEIIFVLVCSSGQLLFSFFLGNINVNQQAFRDALGIENSELPWLVGSYLVALGLSVILSGSLSDLMPPKLVVAAAFVWLTLWNIIGCFSLTPARSSLFFFMRAMQGLAVGVLVSGSMSVLGRVYSPGKRKTAVFSAMAAMSPFGFWVGALQGGAFSSHLVWIFGTNSILSGLCTIAAWFSIPAMRPVADIAGAEAPSIRDFDYKGALCATCGCICFLFGLTQGTVANWSPHTYALIVVGAVMLGLFFFIEQKVPRPLIPNSLWKTPGFAPLMGAYFLGFGSFVSANPFDTISSSLDSVTWLIRTFRSALGNSMLCNSSSTSKIRAPSRSPCTSCQML